MDNKPESEFSFDASAKLTKFMLKSVGLSLDAFAASELEKNKYWKVSQGILFFFSYTCLFLSVIGEMIYFQQAVVNYTGFRKITAVAPCIGYCLLSLTKMLTVSLNSKKISEMYIELREMFPKDAENMIVIESMKKSRKNMLQFVIPNIGLIMCFNSIPTVVMCIQYFRGQELTFSLPYLIWYPINVYVMPWYAIAYALQFWGGFIAVFGVLAGDCPFCLYTAHLCMHFRLLARKMQTLKARTKTGLLDLQELRPCIEEHKKLIRFSEEIESIFSPSFLINFLDSSFMICLSGFQITAGVDPEELITYILFLTSALLQINTLCSYGEQLIDTSSAITWAAYDSPWPDADASYKKCLQLIIQRAQRPQTYTALKFSQVSMESFGSILKASFSYFTLLRTVFNKN